MKQTQEDTSILNQPAAEHQAKNNIQESPAKKWLARLGVAGFMFFFIKGLVWLAVIFGVGKCFL